MHKIRDWLYVSNYASAMAEAKRSTHGITAMLQLYQPIKANKMETKFIGLQDGIPIRVVQIKEAVSFIHAQYHKKHIILSTCGAGISRSVTCAIIALKEIEKLTLFEAYRVVYKAHQQALPDHIHWKSVANYYGEDDDFWTIWGDLQLLEDL